MFKLEIYSADTQELIREKTYKKPELIDWFIDTALTGRECVLFDDHLRTLKGTYVNHEVTYIGSTKVYKIYFHYRLSEVQARIAKLV